MLLSALPFELRADGAHHVVTCINTKEPGPTFYVLPDKHYALHVCNLNKANILSLYMGTQGQNTYPGDDSGVVDGLLPFHTYNMSEGTDIHVYAQQDTTNEPYFTFQVAQNEPTKTYNPYYPQNKKLIYINPIV